MGTLPRHVLTELAWFPDAVKRMTRGRENIAMVTRHLQLAFDVCQI